MDKTKENMDQLIAAIAIEMIRWFFEAIKSDSSVSNTHPANSRNFRMKIFLSAAFWILSVSSFAGAAFKLWSNFWQADMHACATVADVWFIMVHSLIMVAVVFLWMMNGYLFAWSRISHRMIAMIEKR